MKQSRLATAIALGVSLLVAYLDNQMAFAAAVELLPFDSRIELLTEPHAGVTYIKLNGPESLAVDAPAADEAQRLSVSEYQDLIQQLFVWQSSGVALNIIGNEPHFSPLAAVEKYIKRQRLRFVLKQERK